GREDMTVQYSRDEGQSWAIAEVLFEGYAANSDLIVLQDGQLACLFECGKVWPYDGLSFQHFKLPE
ncbi:MAG: sialidase family protein, partial [Bacteroidota bacterium]